MFNNDRTPDLPPEAGIYFLWHERRIVYIGISEKCRIARAFSHRPEKVFDEVSTYQIRDSSNLSTAESVLIGWFKPIYNINAKENYSYDFATRTMRKAYRERFENIILNSEFLVTEKRELDISALTDQGEKG